MTAKLRMPESLEAVFECEVKNLYDDGVKVLSLRADVYERLSKEMHIKVLSTIKPEGVTWKQHQEAADSATESQTAEPEPVDTEVTSDTPEAEAALAQDVGEEKIVTEVAPAPPVQTHDRLPGETDHDFRVRRMREGKDQAQWERNFGMKVEDYDDYVKQQIETASMEALDKGV